MSDRLDWLRQELVKIYDGNPYVGLLGMKVDDIGRGESWLSMAVVREVHGNLYGIAHGGALASLADTAMGVACVTLAKKVVTLEMNMNFIYGAAPGETVVAAAKVIHSGQTTLVVEAELRDSGDRLLAKARGTFFVVGEFEFSAS